MPYIGQGLTEGRRRVETFIATANQTTFNIIYDAGYVDVYQNGILLAEADYTATNGSQVVLAVGAALNDEITIIAHQLFSVTDTVSAAQGGTFTGAVTASGGVVGNITGQVSDISNHLIDEDNMASNDDTKVPSQQSVKAYVDTEVSGLVDSAPSTLDTLNELAAALGDDANFSTTVTNSIATKLPLAGGTLTGNLTMENTDAGSSAGPEFVLFRNSASAADADYLGQIKFDGKNDAGQSIVYAKITGKILDASDGTEDGIIEIAHKKAGSNNISARFRSDSLQLINGTNLTVAGTTDLTGDLTVDTNTLHVDTTNNRVGIGTTSPNDKLHIEHSDTGTYSASSLGTGMQISRKNSSNTNNQAVTLSLVATGWEGITTGLAGISAVQPSNTSSADLVFQNRSGGGYQENMRIKYDGNVGIGTTSPGAPLEVHHASIPIVKIKATSSSGQAALYLDGYHDGGSTHRASRINFRKDTTTEWSIINDYTQNDSNKLDFEYAGSRKVTFTGDAKVGIGTTSPVEHLDLRFSGRHGIICGSTSGAGSYIVLDGAANGDGAGGDYAYIEHTSSGNLNFNVGNGSNSTTTKMLIEPAGNVGIGMSDPAYKLDIGGIGATQLRLKSSGDTGYTQGAMIIESSDSSSNPGNRGQGVYYYNVPNLRTWYTGTLYNNGNKFGFGYKQASGFQVSAADNTNAIMILDGDNSLLELKKTNGTLSGGASRSGATIKLHHEAQWESGYGNNPSASTNDYLGSIEFSTGDNSSGEGVRAAIRGTVDSYYNQNSIVFETATGAAAVAPIERMRVLHNGNVGIGTSNPQQLLHVQAGSTGNGTIRVGGGAGLEISHDNSANTVQRIDSLYRTTSASAELQLRTGILTAHIGSSTTESMRLDGANGLQIMTDSSNGTNADNVSIRYNGTSGGHQSGYLFRDKRGVVNAAIKNDLQDDGVGTAAAHLRFQTSHSGTLTTQMTIDRYGQVMMPNQPSFRAYSTNDYTANGVLESANWTEQHDNNNDFSNGRFTAPVDGVYLFEVMWDSLTSQGGLNLLINTNSYYVKWEPTGRTDNGWESRHYSTTIKLSSGDYVRLVGVHASGSNPFHMGSGHWGFFAGHLLG